MASQRCNAIISVLFVVFGGPAIVLLYLPLWITRFHVPAGEPAWRMTLSMALIAAGLVPLLESIVRFVRVGLGTLVPTAPTEHLVVSGFYRYVRNPMYVGVVAAVIGETLLFKSRGMAAYAVIIWVVIHLFICFYEEPTLARRYVGQYAVYKRHVPRWLPRLTPWKGNAGGNLSA